MVRREALAKGTGHDAETEHCRKCPHFVIIDLWDNPMILFYSFVLHRQNTRHKTVENPSPAGHLSFDWTLFIH